MKEIHQTDAHRAVAQELFERKMLKAEMTTAEGRMDTALNPSRLFQLSQGLLDPAQSAALHQSLAQRPAARTAYHSMINEMSLVRFPQSIAAASGALPVRNAAGCRIRMQESKAEPEQLYLIVELGAGLAKVPRRLTVFDSSQNSHDLDLSTPRNDVIQMIIERSGKIATLLSDPKSEAFLS